MKIPRRFRLGGLTVRVSRKKGQIVINGRDAGGFFDAQNSLIWIEPDSEDVERVFWHEFFHAAIHDSGIQQTPGWSADIEEIIAEKFGRYVAEFLRRNK
jgi:hypothetical protein